MTTAQILKLARRKLLEATTEIFSDDDLLLYANISKDELAKRFLGKSLIKKTTLTFVNGYADKPSDYNGLRYAYPSADSKDFQFRSTNSEDFRKERFNRMLTIEGNKFRVYPESTQTVEMIYWAKLADLGISPEIINPPEELDDLLHELISYGIVWRAFEDLQDFELSRFFKDKWEADFELKKMTLNELDRGADESFELFEPLPDLNFTGYAISNDPDYF